MEITVEEICKMKESLSGITDTRRQWGHILHKLIDVLVIALTTILAGWDEFTVMEDFGTAKLDFFKQFLELPYGIPDERTFGRVFARINPAEHQQSVDECGGVCREDPGALVDREPASLGIGCMFWGGRMPGREGVWGGKSECDEKDGVVPVEDDGSTGETVQCPPEDVQGSLQRPISV
jgi:hypothetical protein